MQWAVLNDKYVNDMFESSSSVHSQTNAEISLTLTRTSRQGCSDNKLNRQSISPRISSRVEKGISSRVQQQQINNRDCKKEEGTIGLINPEKDFLTLVDCQVEKFDEWMREIKSKDVVKNVNEVINSGRKQTDIGKRGQDERDGAKRAQAKDLSNGLKRHTNPSNGTLNNRNISPDISKSKQLYTQKHQWILEMLSKLQHQPPQHHQQCAQCQTLSVQLQTMSHNLSLLTEENTYLQKQLQIKSQQTCRLQISQLMEEMSYVVENRVLHQQLEENEEKVGRLGYLLQEREEFLQQKEKEVGRLREEVDRFMLERSTYQFKNKTLETRLVQLEKSRLLQLEKSRSLLQADKNSKSLLMSAAKNSTSYTQLNTNPFSKSTTMHPHPTLLINTKQFGTSQKEKQRPSPEDYIQWFDRVKLIFLQRYKKEEKQYLAKFHPEALGNEAKYKEVVNQFKKGHVRYQIARSCKNLADYVRKNREGFGEMVGTNGDFIVVGNNSNEHEDRSNEHNRRTLQLQQQLRKEHKICQGLQSQIGNLNRQLLTLKKSLLRQKQQKSSLVSSNSLLQLQLCQLRKQLQLKSLQLSQLTKSHQPQHKASNHSNQLKVQHNEFNTQMIVKLQTQLNRKCEQLRKLAIRFKKCEREREGLEGRVRQLQGSVVGSKGSSGGCDSYSDKISNRNDMRGNNSIINNNNNTTTTTKNNSNNNNNNKSKNSISSISNSNYVSTCVNILPRQHNSPSIVHQFQSRVYIQNHKLSYKLDLINHENASSNITYNTSTSPLTTFISSLLLNSLYNSLNSLILSIQPQHSNHMIKHCLSELFRIKQSSGAFTNVIIKMSVLAVDDQGVYDVIRDGSREKQVRLERDSGRCYDDSLMYELQGEQQGWEMLEGIEHSSNSSRGQGVVKDSPLFYVMQVQTNNTSTNNHKNSSNISTTNNNNKQLNFTTNSNSNNSTPTTTSKFIVCSVPSSYLLQHRTPQSSTSNNPITTHQLNTLFQLISTTNLTKSQPPSDNINSNRIASLVRQCLDYEKTKILIVANIDQGEINRNQTIKVLEKVVAVKSGSPSTTLLNHKDVSNRPAPLTNKNSSSSYTNCDHQQNNYNYNNSIASISNNLNSIDNSINPSPYQHNQKRIPTINQPIPSTKQSTSFAKQPITPTIKQPITSTIKQPIITFTKQPTASFSKQPHTKQPITYIRPHSITNQPRRQPSPLSPAPQPSYPLTNPKHNHSFTHITYNNNLSQPQKPQRRISKHRNSSSDQVIGSQGHEKKKRTISRLSIC